MTTLDSNLTAVAAAILLPLAGWIVALVHLGLWST